MGLFASLRERRMHPSNAALPALWGWRPTASGKTVTADGALSLMPVYAAVRVLAEGLASLPLILYKRRPERGKDRDTGHYLYPIMHDQANEWQTSFEWREMTAGHVLLRGNAYSHVQYGGNGRVNALLPMHPDRVTPRREALTPGAAPSLYYEYRPMKGPMQVLLPWEVLHIKGLSSDGLVGLSPVELAREALGAAAAAEEHAAKFFANAATPSGALEHPGPLTDQARKHLREGVAEQHGGSPNSYKVLILEEGMKWHQIGLTNKDSQFLESRKFSVLEIARMFRVPPHMLMDLDNAHFTNIEHSDIEFVKYSLRPWCIRIEQRCNTTLLPDNQRRSHYFEFLIDGLLRGDSKTRHEAYTLGRNGGWYSANDIREYENLNPLPGEQGDIYLVPLNMVPADKIPDPEPTPAPAPKQEPDDEDDEDEDERQQLRAAIAGAHRRTIEDAFARVIRKEASAARRAKASLPKHVAEFYRDHAEFVARAIEPPLLALAESLAIIDGRTLDASSVERFARAAAERHVSASIVGLRELAPDAIDPLLDAWERDRPGTSASTESHLLTSLE